VGRRGRKRGADDKIQTTLGCKDFSSAKTVRKESVLCLSFSSRYDARACAEHITAPLRLLSAITYLHRVGPHVHPCIGPITSPLAVVVLENSFVAGARFHAGGRVSEGLAGWWPSCTSQVRHCTGAVTSLSFLVIAERARRSHRACHLWCGPDFVLRGRISALGWGEVIVMGVGPGVEQ
jgi:hypothetical protein